MVIAGVDLAGGDRDYAGCRRHGSHLRHKQRGDSVHVIDPATNKVVQEIKGIEAAHGINFSPDGARVYISNEADSTLDVVDRKNGKMS